MEGTLGEFQYSAPTQPGSSGGPVVSDNGELLGVTHSTLNSTQLLAGGALPQNVNFALQAKYVALFLKRNSVAFEEIAPLGPGDSQMANTAAVSAVVRLSCYQ